MVAGRLADPGGAVNKRLDEWVDESRCDFSRLQPPKKEDKKLVGAVRAEGITGWLTVPPPGPGAAATARKDADKRRKRKVGEGEGAADLDAAGGGGLVADGGLNGDDLPVGGWQRNFLWGACRDPLARDRTKRRRRRRRRRRCRRAVSAAKTGTTTLSRA